MRFWDASAIVPLCLEESLSSRALSLLQDDPEVVLWWASPVECASAFARLRRDRVLDARQEGLALTRLRQLQENGFEIHPVETIRDQAQRLLRVHPLRAGDALQLAAAIEWSGSPVTGTFVSFDERLIAAARLEGFDIQ